MRKKYTQVPSVVELARTLEREAKRAISDSKVGIHFASLNQFQKLLDIIKYTKLDLRFDKSWEEALVEGEAAMRELIPLILEQNSEEFEAVAKASYLYL